MFTGIKNFPFLVTGCVPATYYIHSCLLSECNFFIQAYQTSTYKPVPFVSKQIENLLQNIDAYIKYCVYVHNRIMLKLL